MVLYHFQKFELLMFKLVCIFAITKTDVAQISHFSIANSVSIPLGHIKLFNAFFGCYSNSTSCGAWDSLMCFCLRLYDMRASLR